METKVCRKCGVEKELNRFQSTFSKQRNKHYLRNVCKDCFYEYIMKPYVKKNPEKFKIKNAKIRATRLIDGETIRKKERIYAEKNRERIYNRQKQYMLGYKKQKAISDKKWRLFNSETKYLSDKKWREDNAEKKREADRCYMKKNRSKYTVQIRARNKVNLAISSGDLLRGECSYIEGKCEGRIEGHHWDYSKPLEVAWFCVKHHKIVDRIKRLIDRKLELTT